VNTALTITVVSAALWLALFCCYLYLLSAPTRRRRRHGGYVKPRASAPTKDGGRRIRETGITVPISSSNQPGSAWVDAGYPPTLVPPNRLLVLSAYGSETGVPGANGAKALARRVGSPEYGSDAA